VYRTDVFYVCEHHGHDSLICHTESDRLYVDANVCGFIGELLHHEKIGVVVHP
jgi:hypothetical protein